MHVDSASPNVDKPTEDSTPDTKKPQSRSRRKVGQSFQNDGKIGGKKRNSMKNMLQPWHSEKSLIMFMH
eukprot:272507-Karenia_brevis.AAC.1